MAQSIKLKRSAVVGKTPQTSSLELGELGINTTDGKIYFHRSGSSDDTIQSVLTTDATITGSLKLSGSQHISGSVEVGDDITFIGDMSSSLTSTSSFSRLISVETASIGYLIVTGSNFATFDTETGSFASGSDLQQFLAESASYVTSISTGSLNVVLGESASYVTLDETGSYASGSDLQQFLAESASYVTSISTGSLNVVLGESASYLVKAETASLGKVTLLSDITGSITSTGSFGKLFGDGGSLTNVADPDAISGSYLGLLSGSNDLTLGLGVSGSLTSTASFGKLELIDTVHISPFGSGSDLHQFLAESASYVTSISTGSLNVMLAESASYVTSISTGSLNVMLAESASYVTSTTTGSYLQQDATASLGAVGITSTLFVSGNITTSGSVIAREFKTELVSSSIIYSSGSNEFGDTIDDTHIFTGSIELTGSLTMDTGSIILEDGDISGSILSNASFGTLELADSHGFVLSTETSSFASGSDLHTILAQSASYVTLDETGSFASGSDLQQFLAESASYVTSISTGSLNVVLGESASYVTSISTGSLHQVLAESASYLFDASTASLGKVTLLSDITGSIGSTGSFGKLFGDGSDLSNLPESFTSAVISGSYLGLLSGSNDLTLGLGVSGSLLSTGSFGNLKLVNFGGLPFASGSDLHQFLAESASYVTSISTGSLTVMLAESASYLFNASTASLGKVTLASDITGSITSTGSFGSVHTAGNVGINDVDPDEKLSITAGGNAGQEVIKIRSGGGTEKFVIGLQTTTGNPLISTNDGDLYVDATHDINLDAAGGQILFTQAGTAVGQIDMAGTDLEIKSLVSNATFTLRGNDGGSEIDMLAFDVAGGGKAKFISDVSASLGGTGSFDRLEVITLDASISPFASGSDVSQIQALTTSLASGSDVQQILAESASYVTSISTGSLNQVLAESASYLFDAVTASMGATTINSTLFVQGDITTSGSVTAQEFHTELVSSSVIYESGSTTFGDTIDDVHNRTGSLFVSGNISLPDNASIIIGSDTDLKIAHEGGSNYINNLVGNLILEQNANDADIILKSDNGSGGTKAYLTLDGGLGYMTAQEHLNFVDSKHLILGTGLDFKIYHDGSNSYIDSFTGNLNIRNLNASGDTIFTSGSTAYLTLDGGLKKLLVDVDFSGSIGTTGSFGRIDAAGTIKSSGQIEIGSNSNFLTTQLKVGDGTRDIRLNANHGSEAVVGTVGAHNFNLMTGNTFRVNIDGNNLGGMGIGMDAKGDEKLLVAGPVGITGSLFVSSSITANEYGGNISGSITSTGSFAELRLPTNTRLYFDGGGNTFISETSADALEFYVGAASMLTLSEASTNRVIIKDDIVLTVGTGNDLEIKHDGSHNYVDINNGNLYFRDDGDNNIFLIYREGNGVQLTEGNITIPATSKVIFDGATSGHSHIAESAADIMDFTVGGVRMLRLDEGNALTTITGSLNIETSASVSYLEITGSSSDLNRIQVANGGGLYSKLVANERTSVRLIQYTTGNQVFIGGNQELTLGGGTTINELSNAVDFRVESGDNTHAIFLDDSADAVGLFTANPTSELTVEGSISGSGTGSLGRIETSTAGIEIGSPGSAKNYPLQVEGHAYVKGPDGWNGNGDLAIVALGSHVSNENFGVGYKYGTGMIMSIYKSGGGGSFGATTADAMTIADTTGDITLLAGASITGSIASTASFGRIEADVYSLATLSEVSGGLTSTGSFGMVKLKDQIYPSLTFPADHSANKIQLYDGGSEKIGTAAHTMILTAASHSFVGTNGTTQVSIGSQGETKVSGSILPTGDDKYNLGSSALSWADVFAVQTTVGAVFEVGLRSKGIGKEETGTIVVWRNGGLVPCDKSEDVMVMGVIKEGKDEPIVMGAEPVLVTGDVKEGDFITTSTKQGHGKKLENGYLLKKEMFGKVIAQALEDSSGESSLIKCMIRKM